ncbi:MAG: rhodanese-like domain-containing protein [Polyangia bacterium]
MKTALTIALQAFAVVVASAALAIGTNLVRPDGIPLVTEVEYDIFAPCRDTEVESQAAGREDLAGREAGVLYVDARPAEAFEEEHAEGAINVPYSVLFGASDEDVARVEKKVEDGQAEKVIVYGVYADPASPEKRVDFAEPLAEQLVEMEIPGVKHFAGGLEKLKKNGVPTVKASEGGGS